VLVRAHLTFREIFPSGLTERSRCTLCSIRTLLGEHEGDTRGEGGERTAPRPRAVPPATSDTPTKIAKVRGSGTWAQASWTPKDVRPEVSMEPASQPAPSTSAPAAGTPFRRRREASRGLPPSRPGLPFEAFPSSREVTPRAVGGDSFAGASDTPPLRSTIHAPQPGCASPLRSGNSPLANGPRPPHSVEMSQHTPRGLPPSRSLGSCLSRSSRTGWPPKASCSFQRVSQSEKLQSPRNLHELSVNSAREFR
jgi:hypothetical protein